MGWGGGAGLKLGCVGGGEEEQLGYEGKGVVSRFRRERERERDSLNSMCTCGL